MARTTIRLPFKGTIDETNNTATYILQSNGFNQIDYNSEAVWKKGTGLMTAMQYVKLEFESDCLVVSAWVQAGIGNAGGSEMELSGFVAAVPKKSLMKVIEKIKKSI